ncbi:MAG: hypothetical protein HY777_02155 [Betaproteobacteria bacterium]|nr:hypothetical protein [Betaproteobacteria bacterium]
MYKLSKTHLAVVSALAMGASLPASAAGIQGKVLADKAVFGATVCLDKNRNKACDPGEPLVATGADGSFVLTVDSADENRYPVVALIPQTAANGAYSLEAPVGRFQIVSPFTTLIKNEIDNNTGYALDVAEGIVGRDFLIDPAALYQDYIAAGAGGADAKSKATMIAGVLARQMEESAKVAAMTPGKLAAATLYARNTAGPKSIKMLETLQAVGGDPAKVAAAMDLSDKDRAALLDVLEREKLADRVTTKPVKDVYLGNVQGAISYNATTNRIGFSVVSYQDGEIRRIDATKTTTPMVMALDDVGKAPLTRVASVAALPDGSMRVLTATKSETVYTTMEVDLAGQTIPLSQLISASNSPSLIPAAQNISVTFLPGDKMWREDHSKNPYAVNQVAFSVKKTGVASLEAWVRGAGDALSPYENLSSYDLYFKPADASKPLGGGSVTGYNITAKTEVKLGSYFTKTVDGVVYLIAAPTLLTRTNSAAEKVFVYDAASQSVKSASYRDYVRHCLCWQRKLSLSALNRIADALRKANSVLITAAPATTTPTMDTKSVVLTNEPTQMPFCGGCVLGNCGACPLAEIVGMR